MKTRVKAHLKALAGLGLVASAWLGAGCQSDTSYSYFSVKVVIADTPAPPPAEYLARITSCGVNVDGDDVDFAPLNCTAGGPINSRELGSFEWSTTATGTVHFTVNIKDVAAKVIGTGTSADVAIVQGANVTATVVVTPDPKELLPRQ